MYIKAQLKIMLILFVILFVGFEILRIRYSFFIALLIAFLDFLPIFGTGAVIWPWAIIDLLNVDFVNAIGLTVIYGVMTGIENLCRASEILFPLMVLGLFIAIILLLATRGIIVFKRLLPILENGPVFTIAKGWKLITFPYGELITFTMLFKNLNEPKKIKKIAKLAVIMEGIVLSIITIVFVTSLGVSYATSSVFPLLETLRLIRIGGFLDRLDILIIITMVVAGFMKISLFMYAATLSAGELFKLKNFKFLAIPFGIITVIASELIAKSYPQHVKIGLELTAKYIHLPMQIGIPLTAFIICLFKNRKKKKLPS
jgi:spore germination protein KB